MQVNYYLKFLLLLTFDDNLLNSKCSDLQKQLKNIYGNRSNKAKTHAARLLRHLRSVFD